MKNISTYSKEKKVSEIIKHISNLLSNQKVAVLMQPEIIDFDKLSEYLINSRFLENTYFISDSPKFEIKNEKGETISVETGTFQFDKIEDIENVVISNPKKYIIIYNIYLSFDRVHLRCALFDDKLKIRSEKIDKILND